MTNQELFDKVARHLLIQNAKSIGWGDEDYATDCMYRSPSGLKCAIGCLIPDEKYSEELEGYGVNQKQVSEAAGLNGENEHLAKHLQFVHDGIECPGWKSELARIAIQFNLNTDCLNGL